MAARPLNSHLHVHAEPAGMGPVRCVLRQAKLNPFQRTSALVWGAAERPPVF